MNVIEKVGKKRIGEMYVDISYGRLNRNENGINFTDLSRRFIDIHNGNIEEKVQMMWEEFLESEVV